MSTLEAIRQPLSDEIGRYEQYMRQALHSDSQLVRTMTSYILDRRGKSIRPLLVLLGALTAQQSKPLPEKTFLAAMLIEMLHTASLVHDDVIDEAELRRGKPSVNAIWDSHRSVIIGDFILARSFSVGMESGYYDIVAYVSRVLGQLCEGEIIQSDHSQNLDMDRAIYMDIIYKKTATLMGTSCGAGAMSVGAPAETVDRMKAFGDAIGMAFQIKDDILDYSPSSVTGKPSCADLHERKINLPLLTVIENSNGENAARILSLLSDIDASPSNADILSGMVSGMGGVEMASGEMDRFRDEALAILDTFPHSVYRDCLSQLCHYMTARQW